MAQAAAQAIVAQPAHGSDFQGLSLSSPPGRLGPLNALTMPWPLWQSSPRTFGKNDPQDAVCVPHSIERIKSEGLMQELILRRNAGQTMHRYSPHRPCFSGLPLLRHQMHQEYIKTST